MSEGSESRTERDLTKQEKIVYSKVLMWRHIGKGVASLFGVLIAIGTPIVGSGVAAAEIRVYRDSKGVLYITNKSARPVKNAGTAKPRYKWGADSTRGSRTKGIAHKQDLLTNNSPAFGGRIIDVRKDLSDRWGTKQYVHDSRTTAPIHVYRNKQGSLQFTNVPNQPGYRPFLFLQPYMQRHVEQRKCGL